MTHHYVLAIDQLSGKALILSLVDEAGLTVAQRELPLEGYVDNLLLTAVDNLLNESNLDRSAVESVRLGQGIDKNSSICRIIQSFAAALAATRRR